MARRKNIVRLSKDFKTFWVMAASVVSLFLFLAVLQLNDYIHQNSLAKDYEKRIASLTGETEGLEVELSNTNSMENFNKYVVAQSGNFEKVEVEKIKYIKAPGGQLARR